MWAPFKPDDEEDEDGAGLVGVANSCRLLLDEEWVGGGVSGGAWCSRHGSGVAGSW